jgi:hypothetical protein
MRAMRSTLPAIVAACAGFNLVAADFTPAPQHFRQEVAQKFADKEGLPSGAVQLIEKSPDGIVRAFAAGRWHEMRAERWHENSALKPAR